MPERNPALPRRRLGGSVRGAPLVGFAGLAFLAACAPDRSAGGTTGTEAGNAIAARFSVPSATDADSLVPAAGAVVRARPSDAVDASEASLWRQATADDSGRVHLVLPEGLWTLEVRLRGFGALVPLPDGERTSVQRTLVPLRTLRGVVVGNTGTRVSVPGAGLTVEVESDGTFSFDSLPLQALDLRVSGQVVTLAPDSGAVLLGGAPLAAYRTPLGISGRGSGLPFFVPESLLRAGRNPVLLDASGGEIAHRRGGTGSRGARLWSDPASGAAPAWIAFRDEAPSLPPPFASPDGFRLAWIPDLSAQDLSGSGGKLRLLGTALTDSVEGPAVGAGLGSTLGVVDSGLPASGPFGVVLRGRATSFGIENLWLLDWTDPNLRGLRLGMGGGFLTVRTGGQDTSLAWDPGGSWFSLAASWDGRVLRVAVDGVQKLSLVPEAGALEARSSWTRRNIGLGGGLVLSTLLVLDHGIDPVAYSLSGALLPR